MSIRTTADEERDKFLEHISGAIESQERFLDPNIWGEYCEEYTIKVENALHTLRKIRRELNT